MLAAIMVVASAGVGFSGEVDCGPCLTISDFDDVCPSSYFQHFFGEGGQLVYNQHWIATCGTCYDHNHPDCSSAMAEDHDQARGALANNDEETLQAISGRSGFVEMLPNKSIALLDCDGDVVEVIESLSLRAD
jgi:hypothetical protein